MGRGHDSSCPTSRWSRTGAVVVMGVVLLVVVTVASLSAERPVREGLRQPVYRVATNPSSSAANPPVAAADSADPAAGEHALDPALRMAQAALENIRANIRDYTCTMVKRERVGGELQDYEFMICKVRHERMDDGKHIPFSVYVSFLKPESIKGREVIYVAGRNGGKLTAHEGGWRGRLYPTVSLDPSSALAMRNNRYPITEIGIQTLTRRLIEKGERDRQLGVCQVKFRQGAKINNRVCTCLEVVHPEAHPQLDFHLARVFLDDQLNIPIRYEAYDWPSAAGGKPSLTEEYTYLDLKVNVGLTDEDFDPNNPQYNF